MNLNKTQVDQEEHSSSQSDSDNGQAPSTNTASNSKRPHQSSENDSDQNEQVHIPGVALVCDDQEIELTDSGSRAYTSTYRGVKPAQHNKVCIF